MTAIVLDLTAFRARRAAEVAARAAAKADAIARAQPQARACSLAPLEPVSQPEETIDAESDVTKPPPLDEEPEPIVWRTSARGNPWTQIGDLHIVVFADRGDDTQWLIRVQRGDGRGRYLRGVWSSAEAAQQAVERAASRNLAH
jgi:hypothetical protein